MSAGIEQAKEKANFAFDEHCKQWELLSGLENPTPEDMAPWLEAKALFDAAQAAFECEVRRRAGVSS